MENTGFFGTRASPRIYREGGCVQASHPLGFLLEGAPKCLYHSVHVPSPKLPSPLLGGLWCFSWPLSLPLSPWVKRAALQGRCLHVSCALLCRKLPKEINVNTRDVRWPAASWSSVGALPGANCPFSPCPPCLVTL